LDLGRFWQILLTIGLFFWVVILFRGLRGKLRAEHMGNMPWLFFFSALTIPAFYGVGLLAHPASHFTTTDFWRFWVVHLWVEDFLELFTTIMVAYIFVLVGVVRERVALTMIYLDMVLYSAGGIIGTMHHVYFSGEPAMHMALGAFFSAAEVIPLTLLTFEAWSFVQLGAKQKSETHFPHFWAVMFLSSVGFWNFLGAGIFGFLINLPIVSYYEIGTALTPNHGHASMMGVYGMLSVGLALFCQRYMIPACNAYSMKQICTGSDAGREIEHNPNSWLESELSRFHRGISLSLLLLAELLLVIEMIRHQRTTELLLLGFLLVPITLFGAQLTSAFFASRADGKD
jgi:nitric oxide reductase subunit B